MTTLPLLVNLAAVATGAAARARFATALRHPAKAQRGVLRRLLRLGADSAYGRAHRFHTIRNERDFAERVPLADFDELAPWIQRVARGEPAVLTSEPVRFMEPTGGSSGALKLVPYTASLLAEFSAATLPWIFDLLTHRPALMRGRAYWAITPPGRRPARTEGGLPVGMQDDADYLPAPLRALFRGTLAVPASVARAPDVESCRRLTLRALLAAPDLTMISVWSPSFLALLMAALDEQFDALLHDLEHGGGSDLPTHPALARSLRRRFGTRPPDDLGAIWPRLGLISCWTAGHAARALGAVRDRFPTVEIQGKGLLATEGVVSIPLIGAPAPVVALTSHYLEFLDPRDGRVSPAHALDVGGTYEVVLTTGGGLYRYRLHDLARVEGKLHRAPLLSFQGRGDCTSDITGEKLTPAFVERAIDAAARATGIAAPFAMLAPSWTPAPHYRLYAEAADEKARRLADALERELLAAHHYALCRALGQLGSVHGVGVRAGARLYERARAERGQRAGAIKPPALDPGAGWERVFEPEPEPVPR